MTLCKEQSFTVKHPHTLWHFPLEVEERNCPKRTMYPNSMDEILACMMDQSPQKKWDARANL